MGNQVNRDELIGINMPRGGYALAGSVWSDVNDDSDESSGAPMIINSHTPGMFGDGWATTYGSSHDAFLSIVDGSAIKAAIDGVSLTSVYQALPNTRDDNIWEVVGTAQQIQYVVSGADIDDGRSRVNGFGSLNDARGLCVRLPMMACGYGKTKEMLPLVGTGRQNPDSIKLDRESWNTGSVDLRWDDKKKSWVGFNDLIADHESVSLGTAVFSTNPDSAEGFPWLKARLEDAWWVRQDETLDGTSGKTDGATTAKLMTHLEHQWFDAAEDGAAKLSSIFIIPHKNLDPEGTADVPHERGGENTLGSETTGTGASIDLKSSVHFFKEKAMDGPLKMDRKISDIAEVVCCDNGASKLFIGEMIFLDQQPGLCDDVVPPTDVPNEWVPAVRVDECELMGGHIGELVQNDINAIKQTSKVCVAVNTWSKDLRDEIDGIAQDLIGGIGGVAGSVSDVAEQTEAAFADALSQVEKAIEDTLGASEANFKELVIAINAVLQVCCEASIQFEPGGGALPHGFVNPKISSPPGSSLSVGMTSEFPCETCGKVSIQAPCSNNLQESFQIGFGCGTSAANPEPDYAGIGECQTEET
jgi:hypothetical protein